MTNLRLHPLPSWQHVTTRGPIGNLPCGFLSRKPFASHEVMGLTKATGGGAEGMWPARWRRNQCRCSRGGG